ncbi:DUF6528 family protein [Paenibacillus sp. J5C_2022]|uniref:DUF6528 family protein n=1 Tax=Paenibacillus sp. J5C2022 TaxID=2977129 RepID=UPI0021CF6C1F|nr:DUF6528 family protein [Paenibacillus sp. J5C2022]MCU6711872.1 DUF6528 family protein [Paenibacillus sp. J5C2022]
MLRIWKASAVSLAAIVIVVSSMNWMGNARANTTVPDSYVAVADQGSGGRITLYDPLATDWNQSSAVKWSWYPNASNGFVDNQPGWGYPSGVKLRENCVYGGKWMVVVDSNGFAGIIPYPAGNSKKWSQVIPGNLHSIELLPDGNVAIAASNGGWVRIYTSSQAVDSSTYVQYDLPGGHGVLWDPENELLWALGNDHLVSLRITGTASAPVITEVDKITLPTRWGHDLSPVYGDTDRLWVSSGSKVYQFTKSTKIWSETYAGSSDANRAHVKAHGNQPSGQIVRAVPKDGGVHPWTTDTVDFFLPNTSRTVTGGGFYKARIWNSDYQ